MIFWDSSAIVPLIVSEDSSEALAALLSCDSVILAWQKTPIECASALARREREGDLSSEEVRQALTRLEALADGWYEMSPSETVRRLAVRLLRVHALRAADALQLAAALIAAEREPRSLGFLTLDDRLRQAADKEGFLIVQPRRSRD